MSSSSLVLRGLLSVPSFPRGSPALQHVLLGSPLLVLLCQGRSFCAFSVSRRLPSPCNSLHTHPFASAQAPRNAGGSPRCPLQSDDCSANPSHWVSLCQCKTEHPIPPPRLTIVSGTTTINTGLPLASAFLSRGVLLASKVNSPFHAGGNVPW